MHIKACFSVTAAFFVLAFVPGNAHATTPKSCDLLSPDAASALLGVSVKAPMDAGASCVYPTKSAGMHFGMGASSANSAAVSLSVVDIPEGLKSTDFLKTQSTSVQGASVEQISGVGEQALLLTTTANVSSLMVVYHQKVLVLGVTQKQMTPDLKAALVKTMKGLLPKL